jgi:hypothetical protein
VVHTGDGYAPGALAEGKHRADTSKRVNPAFIVLPVIAIAVGVGAYLLFARDDDGGGGSPSHVATTSAETPRFAFSVDSAVPVPSSDTSPARLRGPAKHGAASVARTMSGLYAAAFLDPANWRSGDYDAVWSFFQPTAAAVARQDAEDLTAGPQAGTRFDAITPDKSKFDVKVLFDDRNKPAGYSATVVFTANATGEDGTLTKLFSEGTYFLQPTSRGWRVSAYDVRRADHAAKGSSAAKGGSAAVGGSAPPAARGEATP